MRPERRIKPGMDGGLRAAVLLSRFYHLRTGKNLSKRWGPPHMSPGQINVQAPDDTLAGTVIVTLTNSLGSATSTVTLALLAPSLSLLDNKHVAGVILTPDGSGAYGGGTYDLVGPVGCVPLQNTSG